MPGLTAIIKSTDPAAVEDAFADLAPDPVGPAADTSGKIDWYSEFPDEPAAQLPQTHTKITKKS
jgi:hypothetical protein